MSKHPFPEVAHAAIDGAAIQWRPNEGHWNDANEFETPRFLAFDSWAQRKLWRIKPAPVTVRSRRYFWELVSGEVIVGIEQDQEHGPKASSDSPGFLGWIDESWQTHEVSGDAK